MQGNSHIDGRVMQSPRALHWICIQPIRHHQCPILVGYGSQKANSCVNISNQRRRIVTRRSLILVCRRGGSFCPSDGFVVRIEKQFVTTVLLWTIASWWGILVLVQELLVGTGNLFSWSKSQILQQRPRSHRRPRNAVTQSPALNWHSTNTAPSMCPILVESMWQNFESAATDCDEAFVDFCLSTRRFLFVPPMASWWRIRLRNNLSLQYCY